MKDCMQLVQRLNNSTEVTKKREMREERRGGRFQKGVLRVFTPPLLKWRVVSKGVLEEGLTPPPSPSLFNRRFKKPPVERRGGVQKGVLKSPRTMGEELETLTGQRVRVCIPVEREGRGEVGGRVFKRVV